jgi:hypothetical protein
MRTNCRLCSLLPILSIRGRRSAAAADSEPEAEAGRFIFGGFFGHLTVPAENFFG